MELVSFDIPRKQADHTPTYIAPIGDIQYAGKRGSTATDTLRRHIDRALELKAWFVGLGDYIDFASPSNRQRLRAAALYDCVTEDVRILTRRGWKYHHELIVGELVLGYDVKQHTNVWTTLRKVVVWDHAPVVDLRADGWHWRVTDNHRWVVEFARNGVRAVLPAYELRQGRHKIVTAAACDEDGTSGLTDDEAAVLGWLLTDGHVSFPECWTSYISQAKPTYIAELRELLARSGLTHAETEHEPTGFGKRRWVRWGLSAPQVRGLFERVGVTSTDELPLIAAALSRSARRAMLDAMLHAEGHKERSGGWQFTQKDRPRLDLFLALCALLGVPTRLERVDKDGCVRTGTRTSSLRWVTGNCWSRMIDAGGDYPRETVWCPVTDTSTWVAEYKSQVSITGNTAEDVIDDKALDLTLELYHEYMKPTKGRWLGLVHGHHFHNLKTGETTDQRLCQLLDAKFLGTSAYIRLQFIIGNGSRCPVTLWVHHGCGGGMKAAAPLNKIENVAPYWDSDLFLIGHMTKQATAPINRVSPRWKGRGAPSLVHKKVMLVGCGGFSKGYVQGSMQGRVPMGSYVEQRMLNPASLGAPLIRIIPRLDSSGRYDPKTKRATMNGATWAPEISVEI